MLTEGNSERILKLFFDGPNTRLHVREVARRTGLSPPGAMRVLKQLKDEGLLIEERDNVVVNYRGNYDEPNFVALKRSMNLYSLFSTSLVDALVTFYRLPECITLFGSFVKGEDTATSDIDIAVVSDMKELPDLQKYEEKLKRKISIHLISRIKNEDVNFINSLANGIVLYGYLEVV